MNCICIITYDRKIYLWSTNSNQNPIAVKTFDHIPFVADLLDCWLAIGMSEEKLTIFEVDSLYVYKIIKSNWII